MMRAAVRLLSCALVALWSIRYADATRSADAMLEEAEEAADGGRLLDDAARENIAQSVSAAFSVAHNAAVQEDDFGSSWGLDMSQVRFSDAGVDDEVLPYIRVGATEAELKDAPASAGMAVLHRKHRFARLQVDVLENQLVILSGTESADERKSRLGAGLSVENVYASELACRPINGTAMFMLAHRQPVAGSADLHEIAFFDRPLWRAFTEYMQRARSAADFFGGNSAWTTRIHWNVLPREQREPWVASRARLRTVASPTLLPPAEHIA